MAKASVKIEGPNLIITIPFEKEGKASTSGKSIIYATTGGNQSTDLLIDGKPVILGVNAYISK